MSVISDNPITIGYFEMREPTKRQLEVLRLAVLGLLRSEIAEELCISPCTVSSHIQRAKERLLARTLPQAIVVCIIKKYLTFNN